MCTVTFIARERGYLLGMNRDEKLSRIEGLAPVRMTIEGHEVLRPSEPGGGTWIALNDSGACLALINWYSISRAVHANPISRGEVVRILATAGSPDVASARLHQMPLSRFKPFRLVGIFPGTLDLVEWRWDLRRLLQTKHAWWTQQWVSSGFDEPMAQRERGRTFQSALQQRSVGRLEWLRRLHRSHHPEAGPLSTCMHRADAATVSYTEVTVSKCQATMRYRAGQPCVGSEGVHILSMGVRRKASAGVVRSPAKGFGVV